MNVNVPAMNPMYDSVELVPSVREQDHIQGLLNAPAILVEYGDYQCFDVAQTYSTVLELQHRLGDRLCFVFRHFPMSNHPQARKAAEAAIAAAAQGKFWQMHGCLLAHQSTLTDADLVECAIELELDIPQFLQNVTGKAHEDHIQADIDSGIRSGVTKIPTFFINSIRYQGSCDLESLLAAIAQAPASRSD